MVPVQPTTTSASSGAAVESPSLSTSSALARFEYEAGRTTNDATKVLMVEWEDDEHTRRADGRWHISWKDSESVLPTGGPAAAPAPEGVSSPAQSSQASDIHRLFFLLQPGTTIPPIVTLRHVPSDPSHDTIEWKTNPLPAIFPPELGACAREAGKKGVLHTLWAKKRLAVLQAEIDAEYKNNFEGIGLEMALQEKEWIETNFGVSAKRAQAPTALHIPAAGEFAREHAQSPPSPTSPKSPGGGGRLLEKLRGLRLGTNERDWSSHGLGIATPPPTADNLTNNPLSPQSGDIAVSSFAAIKGTARDPPAAAAAPAPPRKAIVAQAPPAELLAQQERVSFGMASLGGMAAGESVVSRAAASDDEEDGLFALPMSPRSPEMTKSPFSFDTKDTEQYKELATPS